MEGYLGSTTIRDPSKVPMEDFLRSCITGDLSEVPYLGPDAKDKLINQGIKSTFQLIGKYLMLNDSDNCEKVIHWLITIGINPREGKQIAYTIAEKTSTIIKGYYYPDYS